MSPVPVRRAGSDRRSGRTRDPKGARDVHDSLLGMAAGAVVLGWLFEHAQRSVLVVALFHAALNMASATVATEDVAPAVSALVIAWAVLILRAERRRTAGRAAAAPVGRPDRAK